MCDDLLHSRPDKCVFSGSGDDCISGGHDSPTGMQLEFKFCETFTQERGNNYGVKTQFEQISTFGEVCRGYVYIRDDSNLWGKLPDERKVGKEEFESFFDFSQASFWGF